CVQALDFPWTF
nr:immunoglobulin light chain junction region [Macaca mulatta]